MSIKKVILSKTAGLITAGVVGASAITGVATYTLTDNSNDDNSASLTKIEKLLEDNQISRAYDLIRGIKLYGKKNSLNKKKLVNQNPHKNKIG